MNAHRNAGPEARAAWALGVAERVRGRDFSGLSDADADTTC